MDNALQLYNELARALSARETGAVTVALKLQHRLHATMATYGWEQFPSYVNAPAGLNEALRSLDRSLTGQRVPDQQW